MAIEAIIFDFFDVVYADAFKRWLAKRGLKREGALKQASEDMDSGKIDLQECEKIIAGLAGISVEQFEAELEEYRILNEEMVPLLKKLGENYQIGLLSNAESVFLRNLLREHNLGPLFHHICISSEVGMIKPNREIFDHILSKMEVDPGNTIFIDDNGENVRAGEKFGLQGIVYVDMPKLHRDLRAHGVIT